MDDDDNIIETPEKPGKIVVKLPCPPGHMDGLWGNDQAYVEKYLQSPEGYYLTGDAGFLDKDGYVFIMARTDDVINTAGHRISTGRIEEVVMEHPDVAECAVVGRDDTLKGEVPLAFVVLQNSKDQAKVTKELQNIVRDKVGAFAKLDNVVFIQRLPKTRSGKILRNLLRDISNRIATPRITATIEDRSVVPEIQQAYEDILKVNKKY